MLKTFFLSAGTITALALSGSPLQAAPGSLHWSTYLRTGPGSAYPVIKELEHDTVLDVGGCAGGWCKVNWDGATGYVAGDFLHLPEPPVGAAPKAGSPCFHARLTSYPRPALRDFCENTPQPPPAPAKP